LTSQGVDNEVCMRRFSFRLETVRSLREHDEALALEALARELAVGAARDAALARVDDALTAERRRAVDMAISAHDLQARQRFLERLERDRVSAELDVEAQAARIAERRALLETAVAERSALSRLERKQRVEHERAAAEEENARLGEIALVRHVRMQQEAA
jgi:flagellar export protein FliJ